MSDRLLVQTEAYIEINYKRIMSIFYRHLNLHLLGICIAVFFSIYQVRDLSPVYENRIVLSAGFYPARFDLTKYLDKSEPNYNSAHISQGERVNIRELELIMRSPDTAQIAMDEFDIHKKIFRREWNEENEAFEATPASVKEYFVNKVKLVLFAQSAHAYSAPNAARVQNFFNKNIKIKLDIMQKTLTLSCIGSERLMCDSSLQALISSAGKFFYERQEKLLSEEICDSEAVTYEMNSHLARYCAMARFLKSLNLIELEKNEYFALTPIQKRLKVPRRNSERQLRIYIRNYIFFSVMMACLHWAHVSRSKKQTFKQLEVLGNKKL